MTNRNGHGDPGDAGNGGMEDVLAAIRGGDGAALGSALAAEPELARGRTPEGVSLVLFALYCGQPELADFLRAKRASLDVFEAAALGELGELRRELGADPNLVDARSADGFTALHLAVFFGRERAARLLLAQGADVNATTEGTALRPLHSAAASRNAGVVRLLLGAGADPDVQQTGGFTALHSAAKHDHLAMVVALLAAGADPTVAADDGSDAVAFARAAGASQIERALNSSPHA